MKTYIASVIGITAFVGFVTYATIRTTPTEAENLSAQSSLVAEGTKVSVEEGPLIPVGLSDSRMGSSTATKTSISPTPATDILSTNDPSSIMTNSEQYRGDDRYSDDNNETSSRNSHYENDDEEDD